MRATISKPPEKTTQQKINEGMFDDILRATEKTGLINHKNIKYAPEMPSFYKKIIKICKNYLDTFSIIVMSNTDVIAIGIITEDYTVKYDVIHRKLDKLSTYAKVIVKIYKKSEYCTDFDLCAGSLPVEVEEKIVEEVEQYPQTWQHIKDPNNIILDDEGGVKYED